MKMFILSSLLAAACTCGSSQTVVNYTASTTDIPNPGRGFYSHRETDANSSGVMTGPLTLSDVQAQRSSKNITLILRMYYMGQFKSSAISAAFLTSIQNDLGIIRQAGAKVILRFAYNNTAQTHRHSLDASKAWVLAHIGQLKNILVSNSDIILTMQAGFIGTYGEWYYTHPDFTLASPPGTPDYAARKEVSDSLLKLLPAAKMIQVRTPNFKLNAAMYGTGASGAAAAIGQAQAYSGSPQSRIGFHNDCFLADSNDFGTYSDTAQDKAYMEQDTRYVINGGETCQDNLTYTNCSHAQAEMARLHYSYLNNDYNATVLNQWQTNSCFSSIKQKLGYRLELVNGTYTNVGRQGYTYNVDINIRNTGYAPPYEKKKLQLILVNTAGTLEYPVTLDNADTRVCLPGGVYNINTSVGIGTIPDGTYNLYLALKDTAATLINNPDYAVQFANNSTWYAAKGYNLLKTFTVSSSASSTGTPVYSGTLWFGQSTVLPIHFLLLSASKTASGTEISWTVNEKQQVYQV